MSEVGGFTWPPVFWRRGAVSVAVAIDGRGTESTHQRALAANLGCELLLGLLICVGGCVSRLRWQGESGWEGRFPGGPYRHAASPGRPCPRRPSPCSSSWPPALCRCLVSHGCGAVFRGSWSLLKVAHLEGLRLAACFEPVSREIVRGSGGEEGREACLLCSGHPFCDFGMRERVEVWCGGSWVKRLNSSAQTLSEPGVLSGEPPKDPARRSGKAQQALKI